MTRSIFNLALNFHRSPLQHPELMDPALPLPPDISFLLDAVIENKDPDGSESGGLSDEMRSAISFLLERVLFVPGADCYRTLGLSYGAKSEDIRRHYNQLLHIFSFDQVEKAGQWDPLFATQINRAYSVLRDPERRRAYDQTLMRSAAGREVTRRDEEDKAREDAETSRTVNKVSYLGAAVSPAKVMVEEPTVRETRQAAPATARAPTGRPAEVGRPATNTAPPKSSFIANRIDRASGFTATGEVTGSTVAAAGSFGGAEAGEASTHFPKGIPASVSSEAGARQRRFLSMDRSSLVLVAAVLLVLVVYAILLPRHFSENERSAAGDRGTNDTGSVVRESGGPAQVELQGGKRPGDSPVAEAVSGKEELTEGRGEAAGVESHPPTTTALEDRVSLSAAGKTGEPPIVAGRQPAGLPPNSAGAGSGKSQTGTVKDGVKRPSGGEPAAASSREQRGGTAADAASPARKLESLRQKTLQENSVGPYAVQARPEASAGVRVPPPAAAPTRSAADSSARVSAATPLKQEAPSGESQVTPPAVSDNAATAPAVVATAAPPVVEASRPISDAASMNISIQELDRLAATFSQAYEAGNLDLLLGLFSEDAHTNDQSDKAGIAEDYRELFQLSSKRSFTIERLRWEQDKNGGLKGEGDFQVEVQLKSGAANSVKGKVIFYVKRGPAGLLITEMIHSYN